MSPLLILRVCGISLLASTPLLHSQLGSLEECCAELKAVWAELFFLALATSIFVSLSGCLGKVL